MFLGNQSKQFLDKVDLLESKLMLESPQEIINGLPFIAAIRAFRKVVDSCFGMVLDPNYLTLIAQFRKLYIELEISITPKVQFDYVSKICIIYIKVHIVFQHVAEFISIMNTKLSTNNGLE